MKNFKESGIEWLGEIPEHWEVKKLKMLFTLGNGLNITKADFVSYGIPCVSYGEIHSKYPCRLNTTIHTLPFVSKTYLADKPQSLLQKGDFVFVDTSEDIEGSGNFTSIQSDTPIFAGYHTIILKYKGKINSLYFSFLFDSIFTRNQIRKEVCGVKVFSITKSILKEVQCLIPPLKEQEQIANFLDEKCKKIANFIEKKEKLITLLKEQKQALINETITKGLDKNINFKDSGIEWLGEIPQHWEVKKLKMLFTLGNGLNITKADFVSYGIPCVSYGEIHSKYPCRLNTTIHTLPFVSKTYLADKPQSLLQKGDFVFVDTSEDIEGSGNFTSIQSDTPIFAGYHTIILKYKGKINSLYFSFLFDSIFTRNQIRKEVCGVKVFSITKSILKEVQCLIPPLKEQEQIANFLDEKCEKIDLLIEKTKKQIKLIKEYKTTLINQAVCGRINL
ncbi:restriction endonuclease subunit S [Campylobacter jejuni]|uniref:restriction endonuclease subunit S n=3 Tax=Campylobacter jejuni TaxID=197 RepID=UPI001BFEFB99|nr:restriction endonuclease subunit S [Campylobacter jejuni]